MLDDLADDTGIEPRLRRRLLHGVAGLPMRLAQGGNRLFRQPGIDAQLGGHVGDLGVVPDLAESIVEQRHTLRLLLSPSRGRSVARSRPGARPSMQGALGPGPPIPLSSSPDMLIFGAWRSVTSSKCRTPG